MRSFTNILTSDGRVKKEERLHFFRYLPDTGEIEWISDVEDINKSVDFPEVNVASLFLKLRRNTYPSMIGNHTILGIIRNGETEESESLISIDILTGKIKRLFDIPEGFSTSNLKEIAVLPNDEIIFPLNKNENPDTNILLKVNPKTGESTELANFPFSRKKTKNSLLRANNQEFVWMIISSDNPEQKIQEGAPENIQIEIFSFDIDTGEVNSDPARLSLNLPSSQFLVKDINFKILNNNRWAFSIVNDNDILFFEFDQQKNTIIEVGQESFPKRVDTIHSQFNSSVHSDLFLTSRHTSESKDVDLFEFKNGRFSRVYSKSIYSPSDSLTEMTFITNSENREFVVYPFGGRIYTLNEIMLDARKIIEVTRYESSNNDAAKSVKAIRVSTKQGEKIQILGVTADHALKVVEVEL